MLLCSLDKYNIIAKEAKLHVELRSLFEVHSLLLKWFVDNFEIEQLVGLNSLIQFNNVD